MTAVILAGGFGTRMGNICKEIPKPLIEVNGKPVLHHQIEALSAEGIKDFILVTGHLSQKIKNYFGNGSKLGINISYFEESEPLGTAGALFKLNLDEDFLLCNGDLIFSFSLSHMLEFHKQSNAFATLFCHPNSHPNDSTIILTDKHYCIRSFLSSKNRLGSYSNLCNAGIHIISPELLHMFNISGKANLDRDILLPALETKKIFAYKSYEYVQDMGTPERLKIVEADLKNGIVLSKHRNHMQKAIFLDRDGTINKYKGYITNPDDIELLPGVAEAISKFNRSGYLSVIITNQPIIARGDSSFENLEKIHNRLETVLGEKGAYVDAIYYCPHHPNKGFENEVAELKFDCDCRKPKPGLILQAAKEYNIDLTKSYMVGDSVIDILAAQNAGCIPVLLTDNIIGDDSTLKYRSLYDFSESLKTN